jgi:hypothetical protein
MTSRILFNLMRRVEKPVGRWQVNGSWERRLELAATDCELSPAALVPGPAALVPGPSALVPGPTALVPGPTRKFIRILNYSTSSLMPKM